MAGGRVRLGAPASVLLLLSVLPFVTPQACQTASTLYDGSFEQGFFDSDFWIPTDFDVPFVNLSVYPEGELNPSLTDDFGFAPVIPAEGKGVHPD